MKEGGGPGGNGGGSMTGTAEILQFVAPVLYEYVPGKQTVQADCAGAD